MFMIRIAKENDIDPVISLMAAFHAESGYPFDADRASAALKILSVDNSLGQCWLMENDFFLQAM